VIRNPTHLFHTCIDSPLTHQSVQKWKTYLHNYAAAINPNAIMRFFFSSLRLSECNTYSRITIASLLPFFRIYYKFCEPSSPPIYPIELGRNSARSARSSVIRLRRCEKSRALAKESNDTLSRSVLREDWHTRFCPYYAVRWAVGMGDGSAVGMIQHSHTHGCPTLACLDSRAVCHKNTFQMRNIAGIHYEL